MNLEMRRDLVLLADSDRKTIELLSDSFGEINLDIIAVTTGKEAWKTAFELKPSAIVLEAELSDMSGFELCKKLLAHTKTAAIPLVFYTSRDAEIDIVVGFELGASDYVSKNVGSRELALRIHAILRRSEKLGTNGVVHLGKLMLDLNQSAASNDGKRMLLSPTEFQILAVLAKADGRVLNRAEIIAAAWPDETKVMDRTVDAHVKALRAKLLDAAFDIVTVRGVGYSLRLGTDGFSRSAKRYVKHKPHEDEEGLVSVALQNVACRTNSGR